VIVGAPFEDAGAGAAYVYHGCDAGLVDHYAQKLSPALLHLPALRGFAHSFASRMDIDDNRYPGMTARRSPFRSRFYRSSTAIGRLCVCVSVCLSVSLSLYLSFWSNIVEINDLLMRIFGDMICIFKLTIAKPKSISRPMLHFKVCGYKRKIFSEKIRRHFVYVTRRDRGTAG